MTKKQFIVLNIFFTFVLIFGLKEKLGDAYNIVFLVYVAFYSGMMIGLGLEFKKSK